jgi:ketosteroid isomerase-like protein
MVRTPVIAAVALCLALARATPGAAQTVSPGLEHANPEMAAGAEREVRTRVLEFLKKLGGRDVAGVRALLAPKMLVVVVRQQPDGAFATTYQTGDEWLAQFEKNASQPRFEEPIANEAITIESGRLAHVRADFSVVRNGQNIASGVDHFTLVKEKDGWKIAVIAYTSMPQR